MCTDFSVHFCTSAATPLPLHYVSVRLLLREQPTLGSVLNWKQLMSWDRAFCTFTPSHLPSARILQEGMAWAGVFCTLTSTFSTGVLPWDQTSGKLVREQVGPDSSKSSWGVLRGLISNHAYMFCTSSFDSDVSQFDQKFCREKSCLYWIL